MNIKKKMSTPPPQKQRKQPGIENKMHPEPIYLDPEHQGSAKLKNKTL